MSFKNLQTLFLEVYHQATDAISSMWLCYRHFHFGYCTNYWWKSLLWYMWADNL